MKKTINVIFSLLISIILIYGCKESIIESVDLGHDYYPLQTSIINIYKVDSIVWDDFYIPSKIDSFSYYVKECFVSEFIDNQNRKTIRVERFKRKSLNNDWLISDVWYANRTETSAEKVEENIRYVKMIFPIVDGAKWDGNIYNNYDKQEYVFENIHSNYYIGNTIYDSTVTVIHHVDSNIIEKFEKYEVYAKDVGMIFKKYLSLDKTYNQTSGLFEINSGVDCKYELIATEK